MVEVAGLGVLLDEVDVVAVLERGVQLHYVTVVQPGVDLDLADDLLIVHGLHASLVVDLDGADLRVPFSYCMSTPHGTCSAIQG